MPGVFVDGAIHVLGGLAKDHALGVVGDILGRGINKAFPYRYLDIATYNDMHLKGLLAKEQYKDLMLMEGFDFQEYNPSELQFIQENKDGPWTIRNDLAGKKIPLPTLWLMSQKTIPSPEEIVLFLQRQWISYDLADWLLRQHGFTNIEERKLILRRVDEFPTVQDLIHFSVRHGFEPDILEHFGYNKEIPSVYLDWAKKIGLGGSSEITVPNSTDALGNALPDHKASWAEQHWFAHWILPSLGDAYEMLHRLYAESDYGPSPDSTKDTSFSSSDLALFQRAQDIPAYWRNRLQAISFNPLSRVDVRRMFNANVIKEDEVYHSYRAQGYNDLRAKQLLEFAKYTKRKQIEKEELWPKAEKLCKLYSIGLLNSQSVLTYTDKLDIPRDEAQSFIDNCNLENKQKQVEQIIKILKRAFIKGIIDELIVNRQLIDLGIREDAISDYVLQWTLEKQFEFKEDTASEAQKWYEQGIITNDEFVTRLQNIGIQPGSILRMVQSANVTIAERIAREQAKLAKEIAAKAKEAAREEKAKQKEQAQEQREVIKRMLASSTQVNLKKWYSQGLITIEEVSGRLAMLNYSQPDIDRWLAAYGS